MPEGRIAMEKRPERDPEKKNVLLIYRKMIPSIRLCGHCQLEELAAQGKVNYRAVQEMRLTNQDLNWAQIVLLGRLDSWYEHHLFRMLRQAGKYLVYIIDDDLLNIPLGIRSESYYRQPEIHGYIREMIEMSDAILSPSPLLLKKYAVNGKKAVQIEEPALYPVSYRPHDPAAPVKIGFAGSIDRKADLESIMKDAMLQIKQAYGSRVVFEFFGAIPSFADELEARCYPYTESYDEYRQKLNELAWDIGLAPMPDTPFHACKHYNKFVEYAAAGIAGIYSDLPPYTLLSAFPDCAVRCENQAKAWVDSMRRMLDNRPGRERMRKAVIDQANALCVKNAADALWETGLFSFPAAAGGSRCKWVQVIKPINLMMRAKTSIRAHSLMGCVKKLLGKR